MTLLAGDYAPGGLDPLRTHRVESYRVDLLDYAEQPKGDLDGLTGGGVEENMFRVVRGSGTLDLTDTTQAVDWVNDRVRPWYTANGITWPLGVYRCSAPRVRMTATGAVRTVQLMDKLSILTEQKFGSGHAVPAGTVVTSHVRTLIGWTGETAIALTDSGATLSGPMVWDPGTTLLQAINELLAAVNYRSLWCDAWGRYRAEPYVRPAARPITYRFVEGADSIHLPEWEREEDLASVYNRVTLNSQASGEVAAMTSTASNFDPTSPYSIPARRGQINDYNESNVEAADQATLDAMTRRKLIEFTGSTAILEMQHAPVAVQIAGTWTPLALHDRVDFISQGHASTATLQSRSQPLKVGGLVSATWQEVVDL